MYPIASARPALRAAIVLVIACMIGAGTASSQDSTKKPLKGYVEFVIDSQVRFAPPLKAPRYPDGLRQSAVAGVTVVQVVVDTTGLPMAGSLKVVRSAHELFTQSVIAAVADAHFVPARVGDRHVRQLVQLVYRFTLDAKAVADTVSVSKAVRTLEVIVTARPNS